MDVFVTDQPEHEHIDLIDAGPDEYNLAQAGVVDRKPAVLARAPDNGISRVFLSKTLVS